MYPRPYFPNFRPNLVKTEENEALDLGWSEGEFSDGRPYRLDFWCEDQISYLTYYFSTLGLKAQTSQEIRNFLVREGLTFATDQEYIEGHRFVDAAGNEMWTVTVVLGDENTTYVKEVCRRPQP